MCYDHPLRFLTNAHPTTRWSSRTGPANAEAVAYLASDAAAFVIGEVLRVDGGFTTHDPGYALDRAP